jgi:outer membrane protein assembly factor BamD
MLKRLSFFLFLIVIISFSSCRGYQKLLKSGDNDKKYSTAVEYFKHGDYYRALQLFDQVLPFFRGTEKAEMLYYYTAHCYYAQDDYILASYYFKTFAKSYPNSEYAEECMYLNAYCKYLESPQYSLDQSNTTEAIQEIQLFINMFPNSLRIPKCNDLMDILRGKIEQKDYEVAKLYYKMEDYQAAITSFNNLYKDFPDTKYKEDILFLSLKSYYKYAMNSVPAKKLERLRGTLEAYKTYMTFFPDSEKKTEADQLRASTIEQIRLLNP